MHRSWCVFACTCPAPLIFILFFFNDTATTEIYTLSLHDALPISATGEFRPGNENCVGGGFLQPRIGGMRDRKSTRLNSSHDQISYAVFCLKKKKKNGQQSTSQRATRKDAEATHDEPRDPLWLALS